MPNSKKPKNSKPVTTEVKKPDIKDLDLKPEDFQIKDEDWKNLEEALFTIGSPNGLKMDFLGSMLQTIQIDFTFQIATACISYVPAKKQYLIQLNPIFFRIMTREERMGILLHELEHLNKLHLVRIPAFSNRMKANICADAVINPFVPGIPTRQPFRGIFPEDFNMPNDRSLEDYYEMWPEDDGKGDDDGEGDGEGEEDGQNGQGSQSQGQGKQSSSTRQRGKVLDEHNWDASNDEGDMLDGLEELIKRTMVKTNTSYDKAPGFAKDLLDHIDKTRKAIDWKKQLKQFIKRSASGIDKEPTRTRPNKRYDYSSPGLKLGEMPKILFLEDTSGSMSTIEVNAGLDQADQVLKVGARQVQMGFWHTSLYHVQAYKRGQREQLHKNVQSGGTCFEDCAKYINKMKPDAVIVFTDGYFTDTAIKVECPILFVISHGGATELPTTYPKQRMVRLPPTGEL